MMSTSNACIMNPACVNLDVMPSGRQRKRLILRRELAHHADALSVDEQAGVGRVDVEAHATGCRGSHGPRVRRRSIRRRGIRRRGAHGIRNALE